MEEIIREFNPEEPIEPLPIVEEPTTEGEVPVETPAPQEPEVTPEPPAEPVPPTVDYKTLYDKETDHRRNLEKLSGKWANEIGDMRDALRQQFQVLKIGRAHV